MTSNDNRRREIARFTIPGTDTVTVVTVSYPTINGLRRVYSVSAQPTRFETWDHGTIARYVPSEGYRAVIEEAPRYSARKLDALAADPAVLATAERMHARILADRGIVGGAE